MKYNKVKNPLHCLWCGDKIDVWTNLSSKFCSGKCRERYYRFRKQSLPYLSFDKEKKVTITGDKNEKYDG